MPVEAWSETVVDGLNEEKGGDPAGAGATAASMEKRSW